MKVLQLDEQTNTKIVLFLLRNAKNIQTLKRKVITGELDCCVIKPALIIGYFQIVVAANKAALNKKGEKLTTRNLNTELLYNLSISRNITQSLNKFGISDNENNIIVVIFEENGEEKFQRIKSHFEGHICDVLEVSELADISLIKKTYKITDKELEVSQLMDSVVSRISTKEFGSY